MNDADMLDRKRNVETRDIGEVGPLLTETGTHNGLSRVRARKTVLGEEDVRTIRFNWLHI